MTDLTDLKIANGGVGITTMLLYHDAKLLKVWRMMGASTVIYKGVEERETNLE